MLQFTAWERLRGSKAGAVVGAQVSISILTFPASALIARGLGPQILGSWALMLRLLNLSANFFSFSVGHAVAYRVAGMSDRSERKTTVGTAARMALGQAAAMCAVLLPLYVMLFRGQALTAAMILLAFSPITMLTLVYSHALRGAFDLQGFNRPRLVTAILWLISLIALSLTGRVHLPSIAVAFVVTAFAGLVGVMRAVARNGWLSFGFTRTEAKAALGYALRSHPGLALREVNAFADQVIIGIYLGPKSLGFYTVAVAGSSLLTVAASGFMYLAQPTVQAAAADEQVAAIRRLLIANLAVMIPIATAAALTLPTLIGIVYGSDFDNSSTAARILSFAAIPDSLGVTLTGVLFGLGRPAQASKAQALGLLVTLVGLAALLPSTGIVGAATASLGAYTVTAIVLYRYCTSTPMNLREPE